MKVEFLGNVQVLFEQSTAQVDVVRISFPEARVTLTSRRDDLDDALDASTDLFALAGEVDRRLNEIAAKAGLDRASRSLLVYLTGPATLSAAVVATSVVVGHLFSLAHQCVRVIPGDGQVIMVAAKENSGLKVGES